jgi:hypothetical protein
MAGSAAIATSRVTAVWIDTSSATILGLGPDATERRRIESTVPARHRSTGQVTELGGERHGGSGPRSARDGHRLDHLRAFLDEVEAALPADDLLLLGDGVVVERLARSVRDHDLAHGIHRRVEARRHAPLTEPQLLALLREFAGSPPRRYRLTRA